MALRTGFAAGWPTTFGLCSRGVPGLFNLPEDGEVARLKTVRSESARVRDLGKQILPPAFSKGFWHRGAFLIPSFCPGLLGRGLGCGHHARLKDHPCIGAPIITPNVRSDFFSLGLSSRLFQSGRGDFPFPKTKAPSSDRGGEDLDQPADGRGLDLRQLRPAGLPADPRGFAEGSETLQASRGRSDQRHRIQQPLGHRRLDSLSVAALRRVDRGPGLGFETAARHLPVVKRQVSCRRRGGGAPCRSRVAGHHARRSAGPS